VTRFLAKMNGHQAGRRWSAKNRRHPLLVFAIGLLLVDGLVYGCVYLLYFHVFVPSIVYF